MIEWLKGWWETFRVWRETDRETWEYLKNYRHDPDDLVEVDRP